MNFHSHPSARIALEAFRDEMASYSALSELVPLAVRELARLSYGAAQFRAKLKSQFAAGVVGDLLWAWAVKADYVVPADDRDYGIFPGDPSLAVLSSY